VDNTYAPKIWAATALLLATATITFPAVLVENLTAEKVGIPEGDFISPEEAKKRAAPARDPQGGDYVVENAIMFPWVIEDWNTYEGDIKNAFYEITVYSGKPQYGSFDELNGKVRAYLEENPPLIYVRDGEWHIDPRDVLGREDITHELFGDSEVISYHVPMNRKLPDKRYLGYDTAIGWNTLMLYVCNEVAKKLYPGSEPLYQNTITFSGLPGEIFFIYRVDGKEVFIQTSGKNNETTIFLNADDFQEHYENTVRDSVIKFK
jgi:hypothetical protein